MNEIKRLQQLAGINEIKVNKPRRIYDLTKYNPNFTGKDIQVGDEIKLFIYMAVSENEIRLFGFKTVEDLDLFKLLVTVSGVGPKTASIILGEKQSV